MSTTYSDDVFYSTRMSLTDDMPSSTIEGDDTSSTDNMPNGNYDDALASAGRQSSAKQEEDNGLLFRFGRLFSVDFLPKNESNNTDSTTAMHHLPPSDPTRPPTTTQLMNDARRASMTDVTKEELEKHPTLPQRNEPPLRSKTVGFLFPSWPAMSGEDDENENDDVPDQIDVKDVQGSSRTAVTEDASSSYFSPIGPRYNIIDLDTMKDSVWFIFPDWTRRLSGFFLLIMLASIIATSGVLNDSAATVIGAMIVAPLMTPILGLMLGVVLQDVANTFVSGMLVLAGMACAIATGYFIALFSDPDSYLPENNSQVASRINPKLLDLVAALATGAVASIALVRSDIAGSLPGVSIAISLVPPLNVVGICLNLDDFQASTGALLLFITNFICIVVVGIVVMYLYKVHRMKRRRKFLFTRVCSWIYQKLAILILFVCLGIVVFFLYLFSERFNDGLEIQRCLKEADYPFAYHKDEEGAWQVVLATARAGEWFENEWNGVVTFKGKPPFPFVGSMKGIAEDCQVNDIALQFLPTYEYVDLLQSN